MINDAIGKFKKQTQKKGRKLKKQQKSCDAGERVLFNKTLNYLGHYIDNWPSSIHPDNRKYKDLWIYKKFGNNKDVYNSKLETGSGK